MPDVQLHEHLTARLEAFARDQVVERADRTCELFLAMVRREGSLVNDERGLAVGGRSLSGPLGRELLNLAADSAGLMAILFGPERALAASASFAGDLMTLPLPRDIATVCLMRGETFGGTAELGERKFLVNAKPILVAGDPVAVIACGVPATEGNAALLGLSSIETEIIALADQIQSERQRAVSDFLKIIRSIAKRIHLLALNASILSAQAGEHGRGFAVVAREIGDLAERTRQSTQELETEFLGQQSKVDVERRQGGRSRTA
ncbi:MAG TPA: methyl-accepting chemotaxis protein [Myxococcota bacterium]